MATKTYETIRKFGGHMLSPKHAGRDFSKGQRFEHDGPMNKHLAARFVVEVEAPSLATPPDFGAIARSSGLDELKALANAHKVGKGGTKAEMVEALWKSGVDVEGELAALRAAAEDDPDDKNEGDS